MSRLQPARGTSDLLPSTMAAHRRVIDTARDAAGLYGFQEMATPIFEFAEVFSRPLGDSSDVVTKETYNFTDRGGETLTLRPENTAGVVRAMISNGLTQSLPLKFFYAGPMFRYERPQKGRMRQFHQIGIEYLGPRDGLADAEIIACGARVLAGLGVLDRCRLHLNSLGDAESRQAYRAALLAFLESHAAELSKDSQARLQTNPLRILDSKDAGDRAILENAPRLDGYLNDVSKRHFAAVTGALDSAGIDWTFDPLLVRGLDYYCHTAFEFITDALGAQGTVLGGGRYDGLSEMLVGRLWPVSDGRRASNACPCWSVNRSPRHRLSPSCRWTRTVNQRRIGLPKCFATTASRSIFRLVAPSGSGLRRLTGPGPDWLSSLAVTSLLPAPRSFVTSQQGRRVRLRRPILPPPSTPLLPALMTGPRDES